jgi:hypothetical protein
LKGTRVNLLRRQDGRFVKVDSSRVDERCRANFPVKADYGRAVYKAFWPKQLSGFRAGRSLPLGIRTH